MGIAIAQTPRTCRSPCLDSLGDSILYADSHSLFDSYIRSHPRVALGRRRTVATPSHPSKRDTSSSLVIEPLLVNLQDETSIAGLGASRRPLDIIRGSSRVIKRRKCISRRCSLWRD